MRLRTRGSAISGTRRVLLRPLRAGRMHNPLPERRSPKKQRLPSSLIAARYRSDADLITVRKDAACKRKAVRNCTGIALAGAGQLRLLSSRIGAHTRNERGVPHDLVTMSPNPAVPLVCFGEESSLPYSSCTLPRICFTPPRCFFAVILRFLEPSVGRVGLRGGRFFRARCTS